jgi:hypothetical protein
MSEPWLYRLLNWLCEKTNHLLRDGGWIHDRHYHQNCKICGRIVSEPVNRDNDEKHN